MRRFALLGALLVVVGCSAENAKMTTNGGAATQKVVLAEFNAEGAPIVAFSVPNMMCEQSCVPAVRKTLAAQPGVKDVRVDLAAKTATVAVDEAEFNAEHAIAALVDLQFTDAKLITADEAAAAAKKAYASTKSDDNYAKDAAPSDEQAADKTKADKS